MPTNDATFRASTLKGWFLYLRILFGIVSGPLVWGRVAAAITRATQSLASPIPLGLSHPHQTTEEGALNIACYVDDPFLTAYGTGQAGTL